MASTSCAADEEWELINEDDGFVYKRLKRLRLDPSTTTTTTTTVPLPSTSDPEAEERNRRERKKRILLNLKNKYQQEIIQWEHLSNTLKTIQENTLNQLQLLQDSSVLASGFRLSPMNSSDNTCRHLVDDLFSQVEAQEAIIDGISNLCNVAEALCSVHEEQAKKPFIRLSIWESSPRDLITMLSAE